MGNHTEGQLGDGVTGHGACARGSDCSLTVVRVAGRSQVGNVGCAVEGGAV